eukprot:7276231-Alexandrium_andersonii.AAC.1
MDKTDDQPRGTSPRSSSTSLSARATQACPTKDYRLAIDPSLPSVHHSGNSPGSKPVKKVRVVDRK